VLAVTAVSLRATISVVVVVVVSFVVIVFIVVASR
jgi:hypothetical protein